MVLNLDLDEAHAGMVLGQDILGTQGQLLMRAGAVLNDRHLQMLRANRVRNVLIEPAPNPVARVNHDVAEIETHIHERFRISDEDHPLIQELRRLCQKRLTEQQGESDDN